jgi:hypothetical protein
MLEAIRATTHEDHTGTLVDIIDTDRPGWIFQVGLDRQWRFAAFSVRRQGFFGDSEGTPEGFGEALTARQLRQVPIGSYEEAAVQYLRQHIAYARLSESLPDTNGVLGLLKRSLAADPDTIGLVERREQLASNDRDLELARFASEYVELLGSTQHATLGLADRYGYSDDWVRRRLGDARRRGLLTAAPRGKQGGDLTRKARELLKGEEP